MAIRSRNKINTEGSMSSMTDLVFLLLIFFIVLSTLANTQQMQVDLPSTAGKPKNNRITPKATVSITADVQYYLNKELVAAESIEQALLEILDSGNEEQSVVLTVDKTVPTQETIHTLSIIKKHNWKVAISTTSDK